ncbi:hypothetical protein FRB99_004558, partial [Tulasnella sp. 403]
MTSSTTDDQPSHDQWCLNCGTTDALLWEPSPNDPTKFVCGNCISSEHVQNLVEDPVHPTAPVSSGDKTIPVYLPTGEQESAAPRLNIPMKKPLPAPDEPLSPQVPFQAWARFDFEYSEGADFHFSKGDRVLVLEKTGPWSGWWKGENKRGVVGHFPPSSVTLTPPPTQSGDSSNNSGNSATPISTTHSDSSNTTTSRSSTSLSYSSAETTPVKSPPPPGANIITRLIAMSESTAASLAGIADLSENLHFDQSTFAPHSMAGYSDVYRAKLASSGQAVAIKVLRA